MNIGTMKIDVSFLKRPHAFFVYGMMALAFIVTQEPGLRYACIASGLVFSVFMLGMVGRDCNKATRNVERLNCLLCVILLLGVLLK